MPNGKRHENELPVDEGLARRLLRGQAPGLADMPLRPVPEQGTDHTLFRLGDEFALRLPIVEYAGKQAVREATWIPFLAPQVPLALPEPILLGAPTDEYPVHWSVVRWIDGERGTHENLDLERAAADLAAFVRALHACDAKDGPAPGRATWGRGLSLKLGREQIAPWIERAEVDLSEAVAVWEDAMAAPDWDRPPVWFHGDLPGNLIQRDGRIVGVIDSPFGVGDPACDLMAGWTLFRGASRRIFFEEADLDDATVLRSRGWAIAPALIGITYYKDVPHLRANALRAIEGALAD